MLRIMRCLSPCLIDLRWRRLVLVLQHMNSAPPDDTEFLRKALAFNHVTLSYIARGAPLDQLLDRIATGFSRIYPERYLALFLFNAMARRVTMGAAPRMAPRHAQAVEQLEVDAPDTPRFWQAFQSLAAAHQVQAHEMIPLRSFAGEIAGVLVVCGSADESANACGDDLAAYRQQVGASVSMAMLAIERSHSPVTIKAPEQEAAQTDERMALAIEGSGTGIWDRNAVTGEIYYSRGWKAILGYEDWELSSHIEDAYLRVHPDDLPYVQETIRKHFAARSDTYMVEHRIRCKDGSYKWICSRGKVVGRDAEGNALRMIGTSTDITELKLMQERLRESAALLTDLTNEIPGLAFQYCVPKSGEGYFTYVSEGVRDIYGMTPEQLMSDQFAVRAIVHPDDLAAYSAVREVFFSGAAAWHQEFRINLPEAGTRWLKARARSRMQDDGSILWHGFISDVSDSKAIEHELQEFALTDYLTQLPNRRYFMMRLAEEHGRIERLIGCCAAILMCDLDHFKSVNDTFGHAVGDAVLKNFADVLKEQLRKSDTVGRFGGEEFAVILADADVGVATSFAERLQQRFADSPAVVDGCAVPVTLSIGISILHAGSPGAEAVLSQSDGALYRAKESGRNRIEVAPAVSEAPVMPVRSP